MSRAVSSMRKSLFCLASVLLCCRASAAPPDCPPETRVELAALGADVIVVAEGTHGTVEAPAFVAGLLCNFAIVGRPVILAWETPRGGQAALNAFIESDGGPAARTALTDVLLKSSDGRSSLAVLAMLDSVRRMTRSGSRVAVGLVDQAEVDLLEPPYSGQDKYGLWSQMRRQALMAVNVESLKRGYPDHAVVFFTSHASRERGSLGVGYESATLLLSKRLRVYVLGLERTGGSAWQCRGKTAETAVCAAWEVVPGRSIEDADRYIALSGTTASPPASANPTPIYQPPASAASTARP